MQSAGLQREQTKNETDVGGAQKEPATLSTISRRPLILNDANSPTLRLGHGVGPYLPHSLQAKRTINEPGDQYEQEADRVAEQVMRTPDPAISLQRKCDDCGSIATGGSCEECASGSVQLQRRSEPAVNSIDAGTPAIVNEVLRSPGQALDRSTTDFFESRLGHNFADVRVHTNEVASDSAREVGALAYTVGRNIVFGRGQFTPNTTSGRQLIAHELAHVVQQSADSGSAPALQRWPVVRAEEMGSGGTDRFGSRTFDCGIYSVFIPAGAASVTTNRVHVFYSPGGAGAAGFTPGSNAVAVHGLRGAADPSQWIVIGVPDGRPNTISDAQIVSCLTAVGRPGRLDLVRLSAHSRGAEGLVATLRGRHITPGLIDHVTLLDINDFAGSINPALQRSHVPPGRVTSYNVIWGNFPLRDIHNAPLRGMHNIQVQFSCIRSIGYARLIRDAEATGRLTTPVPPDIAARVRALTLPPRGSFSTETPTPPGRTSLRDFCADRANAAALTAMRDGEPPSPTSLLPPRVVTARATTSPYAFIEENNVMSFNHPATPRAQWDRFSPQIYSHHLFVAEIAHEMFP